MSISKYIFIFQPIDNEIPVLNEIRFRSLVDNDPTGGSFNQTAEPKSMSSRSNLTNNIYPYGNVPLSLLRQQIPADIKVGGGNNNGNNGSPSTSKRPSFYQWPLVGNFFGSHGRARFKSLGGGGGTGRKYEPQGQLTPPSLQQLQQSSGTGKESNANSRRPFTRRNNQQQTMSVEDQTKVEYYLLRQQQLHLQQQQFHQANRLLWGDSNRSQQLSVRQQQQAMSFQQYQQLLQPQQGSTLPSPNQWIPQRQVAPPPPPPPLWRPDALVEAEITRYSVTNKPIVELSMPVDHMQQTFAQTLLSPSNQQFIDRVRNNQQLQQLQQQQQQNVPHLRSSMNPSTSIELTTTPTLSSSLIVANVPSSTSTISSSPVTLTTMTISNTLSSAVRQPEIEQVSTPNENLTDMQQSESIQTSYTKSPQANDDAGLSLATAATLLTAKTPSSNRQMNETTILTTENPSTVNTTTSTFVVEMTELSSTINQTNNNISTSTSKEDLLKDNTNTAMLWSDYPFTPESGSSTILMSDELYPNPEQLGQARDEYWSNKALSTRGRQMSPSSLVHPIIGTYYPHPYTAVRPSRFQLQEHQPLYIPLNPADRQSRQLRAQYYADTSSIVKTVAESVVVSTR